MKLLLFIPFLIIIHSDIWAQSDEIATQRAEEYFLKRLEYPESLEILSVKKVGILTFRNLIDKVVLNQDDQDGKTKYEWDNISYNIRKDLHDQLTKTEDAIEEPLIYCYRYKISFSAKNKFGKVTTGDKHIAIRAYPPFEKTMWFGRENVSLTHDAYKLDFESMIDYFTN
jgi:hypothetical protein